MYVHTFSEMMATNAIPILSESESEGEDAILIPSESGEDVVCQCIPTGSTVNCCAKKALS